MMTFLPETEKWAQTLKPVLSEAVIKFTFIL
jgi:hypothetical protein